jgi:hypothetical protein
LPRDQKSGLSAVARVAARKPATTPPASNRLRNVDTKMCAANDDTRTFLHVTRNLLSFARSQVSGTDHELALSLLWRPAISLGAGASAAPVRRTPRRSISLSLAVGWLPISPSMAHWRLQAWSDGAFVGRGIGASGYRAARAHRPSGSRLCQPAVQLRSKPEDIEHESVALLPEFRRIDEPRA